MKQLLGDVVAKKLPRPPEKGSAYVVTQREWSGHPTKESTPLYVGGNSGKSDRFRTRVGDLIADTFGFFGGDTGHHSGGQHLHERFRRTTSIRSTSTLGGSKVARVIAASKSNCSSLCHHL